MLSSVFTRRLALRVAPCLALGLLAGLGPSRAEARPTGENQACANCHYETDGPELELVFGSESLGLGQVVDLTVEIEAVDSEALRTGLLLTTEGQGTFVLVEPEATRFAEEGNPTTVLHAQPRVLDAQGHAQFLLQWITPDTPGVTEFTLWSMTGNSNGESADDHHAMITHSVAHGCDATTYYPDLDADGYGDEAAAVLSCEAIAGMIEQGGDCDDEDPSVNPQGQEVCNFVDDDCDGAIDDGLEPGLYYPDLDGDGFGTTIDAPEFTCNDAEGYVSEVGDCDPRDPAVYPGAPEIENGQDDDCDGEIDEIDPVDDPAGEDPPADDGLDGGLGGAPEADGSGTDSGGCRIGAAPGSPPAAVWLLAMLAFVRRRP